MRKERKKILVVGCSRSGTKTYANLLRKSGVRVRHENMGDDGTVSCYMVVDSAHYPRSSNLPVHKYSERRSDFKFDTVVHLVRNPIDCVPSNVTIMNKSHQLWLEQYGLLNYSIQPKMLRMVDMWLKVTAQCDSISQYGVRIEDGLQGFNEVLSLLSVTPVISEMLHMHKANGRNKHEKLDMRWLKESNAGLYDRLIDRMTRYEYNVE